MNLRTLAAFVIVLAAAGTITAQTLTYDAKIPFSFVVSDATLPAGEYTVPRPISPRTMIIRNTDHGLGALTLVVPTTVPSGSLGTARLLFHRYGDQYFLSQVWSDSDQGDLIPTSRRERDLVAHTNTREETVTVALR